MAGGDRGTPEERQSLLSIAVGQGLLSEDVAERMGWERSVDPSSAVVRDYDTSDALPGGPTVELVRESRRASPTGAVLAWREGEGCPWTYVAAHRADALRATGTAVRTVYVEE